MRKIYNIKSRDKLGLAETRENEDCMKPFGERDVPEQSLV